MTDSENPSDDAARDASHDAHPEADSDSPTEASTDAPTEAPADAPTEAPAEASRPNPFQLGFPDPEFAEERFREIAEEAETREYPLDDPDAFLMLGQVGRTVRELRGGEGGAEQVRTFGAFLFHAFHFDRAGRRLYRLEKSAARYLVETNPAPEGWEHTLPADSGYLQLPVHLFWSRPVEDGPAESIDGVFWSRTAGEGLALLVVSGLRGDRAGFTVVPLPALPLRDAGEWLSRSAREEGEDFETTLPGGELDRLYSIETAGELLKLLARTFGYVATVPESVQSVEAASEAPSEGLSVCRIRLTA